MHEYLRSACMSPTLSGSSALLSFKRGSMIEIRNGVMFSLCTWVRHTFQEVLNSDRGTFNVALFRVMLCTARKPALNSKYVLTSESSLVPRPVSLVPRPGNEATVKCGYYVA